MAQKKQTSQTKSASRPNNKKRKKTSNKLTIVLIVIILLLIIVVGGVCGFFYFKATSSLKDVTFETKNISVTDTTLSFDAKVNDTSLAVESYDIKLTDKNDKEIVITEDATTVNEFVTYTASLSYSNEYTIVLTVYRQLASFIPYDVLMDIVDDEDTITTGTNPNSGSGGSTTYNGVTESDDFQIHFMMLGNDYAGDSIYIKAGDNDILIDAGSRSGSFTTTSAYINKYCTDKKLEYVIATHGDQDHIDAFPKFADAYTFGTIITNRYTVKTTTTYNNMISAFESEVSSGAKWYYADDCWNNTNGAKRQYQLSSNITMDILYNYYYFDNDNNGKGDSSDENNYSVCTLFTYTMSDGQKKYFYLGGDLELEGETKMVEYYDGSTTEKTMPHVDLYKAGHHGSKTSSNENFLEMLQPKMCVVSCCCGTSEYTGITDNQFPTQDFITRIAKWTEDVYVTSIYKSYTIAQAEANSSGSSKVKGVAVGGDYIKTSGYTAMNGNIIVSCSNNGIGLAASNNLTKLKDSEWFNTEITIDGVTRKMRVWPEE